MLSVPPSGNQLNLPGHNPDRPGVAKWTRDAYHCFKVMQDCRQCPLHLNYGVRPSECGIPKALNWLISEGIPVPDLYVKQDERGDAGVSNDRPAVKQGRFTP